MITLSNKEHWLIEQSRNITKRSAVISSDKIITYRELSEKCLDTAQSLRQLGIEPKDNVGILFPHDYRFSVLINALWFIGAVPVPLNCRLTAHEIQEEIRLTKINSLIIDKTFTQKLSTITFKNTIFAERVLSDQDNATQTTFNPTKFNPDNIALIMFTSGSSGKQKAVVHTFNNLFSSVTALNDFAKLSGDDVWLASLSFYHIGGFMIPVRALLTGAAVAFPNSPSAVDIISALDEFQPSHISLVPTSLQEMLDQNLRPKKKLKYLFLGGGPLEKQLSLRAIENGWPVVKVYGSTETCSMVAAINPKEVNNKPDSSGKALLNCKIKIVDENQSSVSAGATGEIVIQSGSVMKEYFGDKTETHRALHNGWYHTGDFGRIDNDGFLFVESRREDLIISGGENVSAREVEEAISSYEEISEAFVFGIDDNKWGQIVCAAVVSERTTEEELIGYLKSKIASYKIPKRFFFMDKLPRNEMSKVDRKKLFEKINLR